MAIVIMQRRRSSLTEQGRKERELIDEWKARLGEAFRVMQKRLEDCRLKELVQEARLVATLKPTSPIKRVCTRHKEAAVCWFVENDMEQLTRRTLRIASPEEAPPAAVESAMDDFFESEFEAMHNWPE